MLRSLLLLLSLTVSFSAAADEQVVLGEVGESCRARADCQQGLACVKETCIDPNAPPPVTHVGDERAREPAGPPWSAFRLGGVHAFVGLGASTGPVVLGVTGTLGGGFNKADGAFLFALHGGLFIGRSQLLVELSPFAYLWDHRARGPAFEINGSYAYFVPVIDRGSMALHWPLRFGIGTMAGGDNTSARAYFQLRADIVGLALQIGHVMLEFHAPSFRYLATAGNAAEGHVLTWLVGVDASYVF